MTMKRFLAIIFALSLALSLAACTTDDSLQNNGGQNSPNGPESNIYPSIPAVQPKDEFSPYGTWVWVGNDKFTMTLNEDGTAVFSDKAENSYINLYSRLQKLWMSAENTFTYTDGADRVITHMKVDDRKADMEYKIKYGDGFYILDQGAGGYDFVRAENYSVMHDYFMNGPIRDTWYDLKPLQIGETVNIDAQDGVTLTLNNLEMDNNYDLKVYITLSAEKGVSSFDWISWTLYNKGAGGLRSDRLYFYDLNGQEVDGLTAGKTVEGYFTIASVDDEQSNTWYGGLKAGIYISGMSTGEGCCIILPAEPNK